jgi:hypothetical protein
VLLLALAVGSCSRKREDFEVAKAAIARELRSPETAKFCSLSEAEFTEGKTSRTMRLWVESRNLQDVLVRTHFEATIDAASGRLTKVTCLECAAEDERQKLNEAVDELQALSSPSK